MTFAGTVAWMSPEILRHEPCSEKVDVWSYGVLLWEMLTQEKPYNVSASLSLVPTVRAFHACIVYTYMCRVSWVRVPPGTRGSSYFDCLGYVVLLCFVVCLTLLASSFLPSASLINIFVYIQCMYRYIARVQIHVANYFN